MTELSDYIDATAVAAQLGRLDLVSSLLALIGLALVLGGIFAFVNFRSLAKNQAEKEAREVAESVAEREANKYLQRELPDMIKAYWDMIADSERMTDRSASEMAEAQEDAT